MIEEKWRLIPEFPRYEVSNLGNIYNYRDQRQMRISYTPFGHAKITLTADDGVRHTRSVPLLVADAFVRPPNVLCDHLIVLDGDLTNVCADNLAWRPRGFAWEYVRQLKLPQPLHFRNLRVANIIDQIEYSCIVEAGVAEGLLFKSIWYSTYSGEEIFPYGSVFEIIERV